MIRLLNWTRIAVTVWLGLSLTWSPTTASSSADSLFEAAISHIGIAEPEESLEELKAVVRLQPKRHAAWHELAKLHKAQLTPEGRLKAERSLGKALREEPENVDYLVTRMDLLWD